MGNVSSGMGERFSALLVSQMALWLALVDQKPVSAEKESSPKMELNLIYM